MAKVLVFGDVCSRVDDAIAKANTINKGKNGPFNILLLLGEPFGTSADDANVQKFSDGQFPVDLPTYFFYKSIDSVHPLVREKLDDGGFGEICPNLTCLGSCGKFTTSENLRISFNVNQSPQNDDKKASEQSDIFISGGIWPKGIERDTDCTSTMSNFKSIPQSDQIRKDVLSLQPTYHFATVADTFWERLPFKWAERSKVTRFICLSQYGGSKKWFYAFNIDKDRTENAPLPIGTTSNPLEGSDPSSSMIWSNIDNSHGNKKRSAVDTSQQAGNTKRRQRGTDSSKDCFFCIANSSCDKDLIVSIAEESYLALAKGPLKSPKIPFPHHLIAIPLSHVPILSNLGSESLDAVKLERKKYKLALSEMYAEHDLVCVSFEISRNRGFHFHTQIIAIPGQSVENAKNEFKRLATDYGYPMAERDLADDEDEYFRVEFPDGQPLVIELTGTFRFDLQFGRTALANVLDIPDQLDWKACAQTNEDEKSDGQQLKSMFKKYDFTA